MASAYLSSFDVCSMTTSGSIQGGSGADLLRHSTNQRRKVDLLSMTPISCSSMPLAWCSL